MTKNYKKFLQSEEWINLKKIKHSKKKKGCAFCGSQKFLELHHLIYRENPYLTEPEDLKWACCRCHQKIHDLIDSGHITTKGRTAGSAYSHQKAQVLKHLGIKSFMKPLTDSVAYKHDEVIGRKNMSQEKNLIESFKKLEINYGA